jgi:hypothetical protein
MLCGEGHGVNAGQQEDATSEGTVMPIFISYSHKDSQFVDKLAHQLVQHDVRVWLDRWELHVGDSLISRIQQAITGASALLVILSKSSVSSPWCEKEMNSGLLRELEERRVVVLPVLIEDCQIPLFLREKLYADFRSDFDAGLQIVLESVAKISNMNTGRIDEPAYHSDWAMDWGETHDGNAWFRLTIIQEAVEQAFTVLTTIFIHADAAATRSCWKMVRSQGTDASHKHVVKLLVNAITTPKDLTLRLEDQFERTHECSIDDSQGRYHVRISSRRLGVDTGRNVIVYLGDHVRQMLQHMDDVTAQPVADNG